MNADELMREQYLITDEMLLDELAILYRARSRNMNALIEKVFGGERAAKVRYSLANRRV